MGLDITNAPGLQPHQKKQALDTNYLAFNSSTGGGTFAEQYLPELYEAEVERFGNRTLQGFLRMVGAEMPMTSDQVIWSEQNRLHVSYDVANIKSGSSTIIEVQVENQKQCVVRKNQTVVISDGLNTVKAKVSDVSNVTSWSGTPAVGTAEVTVVTYKVADLTTNTG